ncbi:uncharacterized protein EV154DRAFT_486567 [Mucor mucedo]|uniref:uncharacterized protein n=1 Tax=Mucor mucedo TaxID=29922 RepID=UPI0022212B10|nr:uncharacterized protein EV154DRAFT_486567 [Mucor mucedo]KAI7876151.1 hypothetical protein EV154DRAFT_486567 [Mucor mucedo]
MKVGHEDIFNKEGGKAYDSRLTAINKDAQVKKNLWLTGHYKGFLVPEAAKNPIILYGTAYRIWNRANESDVKGFPGFKKISKHDNRGRPLILIKEHIQFLLKYVE